MITHPLSPTPNLLNIYSTVNAHSTMCQPKAGLLKQTLGGEWSRPFCSRPRVGSSKGPKPVVMRGPERVPEQKVSPLDRVTPRFYHGILRETRRNRERQREMVRNGKKWCELTLYHGSKCARVPRYHAHAVLAM